MEECGEDIEETYEEWDGASEEYIEDVAGRISGCELAVSGAFAVVGSAAGGGIGAAIGFAGGELVAGAVICG